MVFVAIHGFEPYPPDGERLLNRWIDHPGQGTTYHAYSIRLEGWLLFKQVRPIRIEIRLGGLRITTSKAFVERPDVLHHFENIPDASAIGFSAEVNTLLFPVEFEMQVVVIFEDDSETPVGGIKGNRSVPAESVLPTLQPFRVCALGRSGTTLMMRYLLNHPQIIAHNRYPYEVRMMTYFQKVQRVLTSRADHKKSAHPDRFVLDRHHVGFNPYYEPGAYGDTIADWFNESHIEATVAYCKRSLDNFYLALARAQDKPDVRLFAEKEGGGGIDVNQWIWYPNSRSIVLVRDFRDRHCSIVSFNKKRGFNSFGFGADASEESVAQKAIESFRVYQKYMALYPAQIKLVRYEDLLQNPRETVSGIFEHAGLDMTDPVIDEVMRLTHLDDPKMEQHRTSEVAKSIGRWKKDLDPTIASFYADAMGDVMSQLGYGV
jgi:hypothetical protein